MVTAILPIGELVAVVRAAGMAGLALAIDGQERGNFGGEIGNQAIARAAGGNEVRPAAGIADGDHVSAYSRSAVPISR